MNLYIKKVGNTMVPDAYYNNIYEIDYNNLKKHGIKNLFFDVDNTLVPYTEDEIRKDNVDLIKKLKQDFNIIIVSNSMSNRVLKIVKDLDVKAYYSSMKPLKRTYKKILKEYNIKDSIFIGDQFMTDVLGAKRMGFKVIFVDRISNIEPITTKFWRLIEKQLLKKYKKNNAFVINRYYDNIK